MLDNQRHPYIPSTIVLGDKQKTLPVSLDFFNVHLNFSVAVVLCGFDEATHMTQRETPYTLLLNLPLQKLLRQTVCKVCVVSPPTSGGSRRWSKGGS